MERPIGYAVFKRELRIRFERQRHAAVALGVTESYLSDILNGWKVPGRRFRQRASGLFGVPEATLFPKESDADPN